MSNGRIVLPPPNPPAPGDSSGGPRAFVSRAGHKLEAALAAFHIDPAGRVCADLGANVGGFTDCLLQHGAAKVYAVDTAYGVIAWTLRKNPRVVVRDRTNALHVHLPEPVSLVTVDVGWTRQEKILPVVATLLPAGEGGIVLSLIKPHYESDLARVQRGVLMPAQSEEVLWQVVDRLTGLRNADGSAWKVRGIVQSPVEGQKGNVEYVAWLERVV